MPGGKPSILEAFCRIRSEKDASKPDICVKLWKHLSSTSEVGQNDVSVEFRYCLERLIRGLGSPRAPIRKSYFASLVSILRNSDSTFCTITLDDFKVLVDAQLSKYESKGEEGEVLSGRILAYGIAMKSNIFMNGAVSVQKDIIREMLEKSSERSYLPQLTYTFITEFMKKIEEDVFRTILWPVIVDKVMVMWSSQSLETLHCLLEIQELHPNIIKKEQILTAFGTPSILHEETIGCVQKMLMNITWEPRLKHPAYEIIGRSLSKQENDFRLLDQFWLHVEEALSNSPTRLKIFGAFTILCVIIKHVQLEKIPDLLTGSLVANIFNACRSSAHKTDGLCVMGRNTLQCIIARITTSEEEVETASVTIFKVLCKLIFESGQMLADKITGVKTVFPCVSKLDEKHIKLLAKRCENVIFLKCNRAEDKDDVQRVWHYKDRCYATQLLARLISHPRSCDMNWKIKHLKLMMRHALFVSRCEDGPHLSGELASTLKNSFFTALSHQLSHLENHRMVLISLVFYIDHILTTGKYELRTKLSDEIALQWNDNVSKIHKIGNKISKSAKTKTIMHIFHTLFLQMALHLFVDPVVAKSVLLELDRCYRKEKVLLNKCHEQGDDDSAEPEWIEMTVELFLSLLSHDTYLLRQLIARMFPQLCQHLTAQAAFQILQVFDPHSNDTILMEEDADSDDVNGLKEDELEEETNVDVASSTDSEIDDIDDAVEDTAVERTRQAVRDALGMAGSVTDTESIDLDDIDEEEGRKLDAALAQAFKNVQKSRSNKNKKQSASDKALTNFRIRVLDLVDIYLDNNPSLGLVLDTIPVLFKLLEFTLKDSHQKPLENRIRSTIKRIGHLKKCENVKELDENLLVDSLKCLTDKGVRSTPLFLGLCDEMSQCCTFLVRMQIHRSENKDGDEPSLFFDTLVASLENFFLKRDCLLPMSLFENVLLKTNWIHNLKLCEQILRLSFDTTVRGYRRNQGLSLLNCFYKNTRLLSMLESTSANKLNAFEHEILVNAAKVLERKAEVNGNLKTTFVSELFSLLCNMKHRLRVGSSEWTKLADIVRSFLNEKTSSSIIPRKCVSRLSSALHINLKIDDQKFEMKHFQTRENYQKAANGMGEKNSGNAFTCIDDVREPGDSVGVDESVSKTENVLKKRKSKRRNKTEECRNAKRLRTEIANDVEVLKFSETKLLKSF